MWVLQGSQIFWPFFVPISFKKDPNSEGQLFQLSCKQFIKIPQYSLRQEGVKNGLSSIHEQDMGINPTGSVTGEYTFLYHKASTLHLHTLYL